MDDLLKVFGAKLAAQERLIELLLVEALEKYERPIARASELADILADSTSPERSPELPQELHLRTSEEFNQMFDRVVAALRQRGHQQ